MKSITRVRTGSKYEVMGSYARAVSVGDWIFVSNTAGRNPHTQIISDDVCEQALEVFALIERALAAADSTLADVVVARIFIQDPKDTSAVMALVGEKFRDICPAMTITCPPLGASIYKVEIEVTAYRGASGMEKKDVII